MIGPEMGTSSQATSIGDALFGRARQRVLGLLFGRPDSRFYLNEIVREAQSGKGAVQRELASLISSGLVEAQVEGRQRYFRASRQSPVFAEIEALVRKTFGVSDAIRSLLLPFRDQIEFAGIYGSTARGTAGPRSDIDLLIIGDVDYLVLSGALADAEASLRRPVNSTVFTRQDWDRKVADRNAFVHDVLTHPLTPLIGDVVELGKPRKDGAASSAAARPRRARAPDRSRTAKPARRPTKRTRS
jgi:predicted nucleotidyltransferase